MDKWDDSDAHWLAGLTDGEGTFYLQTRRRRLERHPGKLYRGVSFLFAISLRSDDEPTLRRARAILGVGRVTPPCSKARTVTGVSGKTYHGNPLSKFVVGRRSDLEVVIRFFRRYRLRGKNDERFRDLGGSAGAVQHLCDGHKAPRRAKEYSGSQVARQKEAHGR